MSITVETRFVFNVKFYQDVLGQCTSMKRRVSIWNGSRHKTFTLVGHGCGKPNFNTLHPNNSMHIPHTVRHTFPKVLTRRICLKICPVVRDQRIKYNKTLKLQFSREEQHERGKEKPQKQTSGPFLNSPGSSWFRRAIFRLPFHIKDRNIKALKLKQ